MFSYYGSKSNLVRLYPKPKHGLIIEPFAGSARYALNYFDRDVLLIDANPVIANLWKFLINASEKDILSLPATKDGADLRDFNLTDPERHLIYFCSTGGGAGSTGFKVRARTKNCTFNNWENAQRNIAKQLHKIRHWQIVEGDYRDAPDVEATYFIDPPYFSGGHKYTPSNKQIDFDALAAWSKTRKGQSIVCENSEAGWLAFLELKEIKGIIGNKTTEVFWTNESVAVQSKLF